MAATAAEGVGEAGVEAVAAGLAEAVAAEGAPEAVAEAEAVAAVGAGAVGVMAAAAAEHTHSTAECIQVGMPIWCTHQDSMGKSCRKEWRRS